jgi:hypothetical protein
LGGFWPPTPGEMTRPWPFSMGGETLTPQRCIPNMKTIPSKLSSVASRNQTVSGGGCVRTKTKVSPTSSGDTIIKNRFITLFYEGLFYLKYMSPILVIHVYQCNTSTLAPFILQNFRTFQL